MGFVTFKKSQTFAQTHFQNMYTCQGKYTELTRRSMFIVLWLAWVYKTEKS